MCALSSRGEMRIADDCLRARGGSPTLKGSIRTLVGFQFGESPSIKRLCSRVLSSTVTATCCLAVQINEGAGSSHA